MFARFAATVMLLLTVSAPAWAAAQREDLQIFRDVSRQVLRYPQFTIFDSINAQVDDGVVTLTGRVTMPYKRDAIAERIARIDGVRELRNEVAVLPVSQFDDELRLRIARAIYGNSNFWTYGAMANPPIHIIVENGNITLTGLVNSQVEKAVLGSIARGTLAFRVDNQVQIESELNKEPVKKPAAS